MRKIFKEDLMWILVVN